MRETKPEVYSIGKTKADFGEVFKYLEDIGNPDWEPSWEVTDGENIAEIAGRLCYRSWQPYDENKPQATNQNVKRVRQGNKEYLKNVLAHKHGNLFMHVHATFLIKDCSRVFTHELVRHMTGTAYSQESLRYVLLEELGFWFPECIQEDAIAKGIFLEVLDVVEKAQKKLSEHFKINEMKDFNKKKVLTSAFRRIAPIGLATGICVTANMRAWRHILELRSSPHAEEEAILIMNQLYPKLLEIYPNILQDSEVKGDQILFENSKV